ncbi:MAG: hypothetical protein D6798_14680 [Deltaproteobacteria bacterium]|nr:MAG: hypothetical protein D6798_14680 [Deltaproteobacteria bacterium]
MSAWSAWVRLLDEQERGTSLALVRIGVGLSLLLTMGLAIGHDVVDVIWVDRAFGGARDLGQGTPLVALLGGPTPAVVHLLVAITALSGLFLAAGLGARLAAFCGLQGLLALTWLNGHAGGSYDDLLSNALWLLVLARSDATGSLACRLRTGRWTSDARVASWPRWLLVFQLVVMYASTGMQKLSAHWVPGGDLSALYYILQQPSWQRTDMAWIAPWFPVTRALTLVTWAWEISAPLVLLGAWARRPVPPGASPGPVRRLLRSADPRFFLVAVGLPMHLGALVLLDVGPFSIISLSLYPALWHPDELAAASARLQRLARPGPVKNRSRR